MLMVNLSRNFDLLRPTQKTKQTKNQNNQPNTEQQTTHTKPSLRGSASLGSETWVKRFFWLFAAWVKSGAERPSVSGVNRQLHVQIGCKLGIRNRKDELTKQARRNKLQIKPEGN